MKILSQKILIFWNYAGIIILASVVFVFNSSIYLPQLFGSEVPLMPLAFGSFPSVLVVGFLIPSAIFVHFLSIAQLKKNF